MSNIEKRLELIEEKIDRVQPLGAQNVSDVSYSDDEIDLKLLWAILWGGKWIVGGIVFIFALAGVIVALSRPNVYSSTVLVAPANDQSGGGFASMPGQLGGLASLAGINLGGGGGDKTTLAIEVLQSREFIMGFIDRHNILVDLMAAEGWNQAENKIMLDSDIYDESRNEWVRKVSAPRSNKPSLLEAYQEFSKRFSVSQDKLTSYVSVSVEFYSPYLAQAWTESLMQDLNEDIKRREVEEARRSIAYLNAQIEKTSVAEMRSVFYELIEEQAKIIMFAEAREEYVFKTIDSAVIPELKSGPNRPLVVLVFMVFGCVVSVIYLVYRYFKEV